MTGAGHLNRKVVIEVPATGTDDVGQPLTGWALHREAWANYKAPTGMGAAMNNEPDANGVGRDIVRCSWRLNYCTDITVDMRLNHKGTFYDIKSVLPDHDRRRHTDLVCTVGGSNG